MKVGFPITLRALFYFLVLGQLILSSCSEEPWPDLDSNSTSNDTSTQDTFRDSAVDSQINDDTAGPEDTTIDSILPEDTVNDSYLPEETWPQEETWPNDTGENLDTLPDEPPNDTSTEDTTEDTTETTQDSADEPEISDDTQADTEEETQTDTEEDTNSETEAEDSTTCQPGFSECVTESMYRICRNDGLHWDMGTCLPGQPCQDGACFRNCTDTDNDGYGVGEGCFGTDCDESNPTIFEGALEICENGVDENCDGVDVPCECDPVLQNCGTIELKCGFDNGPNFACQPAGDVGEGQPCNGNPSNCQAGLLCLSMNDGQPQCVQVCNPQTSEGCSPGTTCNGYIQGIDPERVALCMESPPSCDMVLQDCPNGEACFFMVGGLTACFEYNGTLPLNGACDPNNDQCVRGAICVTITNENGSVSECKHICRTATGQGCTPGQTCSAFTNQPDYGACI